MIFKIELSVDEAKVLYESGVMEQIDKVIAEHHKTPMKQQKEVKQEVKQEVKEEAKEVKDSTISMEEVRERVVSSVANKEKAKEIMSEMGVKKLTSLNDQQLQELYDALGA